MVGWQVPVIDVALGHAAGVERQLYASRTHVSAPAAAAPAAADAVSACALRLRRARPLLREPLQAEAGPGVGGLLILWWAGGDLQSTSLSGTLPESIGGVTQLPKPVLLLLLLLYLPAPCGCGARPPLRRSSAGGSGAGRGGVLILVGWQGPVLDVALRHAAGVDPGGLTRSPAVVRLLLLLLQPAACQPLQADVGPGEGGLLIRWCAGRALHSTSLSGTLPESIGGMTQLGDM